MSIEFTCPECGRLLRTRDERAGARALCPECDREITVPQPDLSETAAFISSSPGALQAGVGSAVFVPSSPPRSASTSPTSQTCTSCGVPRPEGGVYCAACGNAFVVDPLRARGTASVYGGFWLRTAAWFLDTMILSIVIATLGRITFSWIEEIWVLVWWLYYALLECSEYQATFGKMAVGLVVTDEYGSRISFGRATGRTFAKILSVIPLFFGFVMAGISSRKQALHDILAGCLVLRKV